MSTDYDLKCKTCGVELEIVASGSISYGNKLWRNKDNLDALQRFFFAHIGHDLVFQDSDNDDARLTVQPKAIEEVL